MTQTDTIQDTITRDWVGNFSQPLTSGAKALEAAGIDWTVKAVSLQELTELPGSGRWVAAVRESDDRMIGCNGTRHTVIQNSAMADWADTIMEMNDSFQITAGGAFPSGDKAYLVLTSDHVLTFGQDDDEGFSSVMLVNDFNGNSPLQGLGFVGRLFCRNQFSGILRRKTSHRLVSVSHTKSSDWKVVAARDTLRGLVHEMDEIELELQRLLKIKCTPERGTDAAVGSRPEEKFNDDGEVTNQRSINDWERKREVFKAELHAPWNEHLSRTALGMAMAAQGIDEHLSKSADREVSRVNRIIGANYPTMNRVLAAIAS